MRHLCRVMSSDNGFPDIFCVVSSFTHGLEVLPTYAKGTLFLKQPINLSHLNFGEMRWRLRSSG